MNFYDTFAASPNLDIGPWNEQDQPVKVRTEIQRGLPGLVFEWADGRISAIFLSPSTEGEDADVFVYRTDIVEEGEALVFDPNDATSVCFVNVR